MKAFRFFWWLIGFLIGFFVLLLIGLFTPAGKGYFDRVETRMSKFVVFVNRKKEEDRHAKDADAPR